MNEQADLKFLSLLRTAGVDLKSMLRIDAKLFQAEFSAGISTAVSSGIWGTVALILLSFSSLLFIEGLVLLLVWLGIAAYLACMIVAAVLGAFALICGLKARASAQTVSFVPAHTVAAVKKDIATLKGALLNVDP